MCLQNKASCFSLFLTWNVFESMNNARLLWIYDKVSTNINLGEIHPSFRFFYILGGGRKQTVTLSGPGLLSIQPHKGSGGFYGKVAWGRLKFNKNYDRTGGLLPPLSQRSLKETSVIHLPPGFSLQTLVTFIYFLGSDSNSRIYFLFSDWVSSFERLPGQTRAS